MVAQSPEPEAHVLNVRAFRGSEAFGLVLLFLPSFVSLCHSFCFVLIIAHKSFTTSLMTKF